MVRTIDYLKEKVEDWKVSEAKRIEELAYRLGIETARDWTRQLQREENNNGSWRNKQLMVSDNITKNKGESLNSRPYGFNEEYVRSRIATSIRYNELAKIRVLEQRTFRDYIYSWLDGKLNGNGNGSKPTH